jgi:ABC-type proline/glycine betaine transport system substrate-binding protein
MLFNPCRNSFWFSSPSKSNNKVFISAIFTAWLPVTHGEYMKQVGDKVEDLGPNYEGARIGLVVPAYVDINSIEELNN